MILKRPDLCGVEGHAIEMGSKCPNSLDDLVALLAMSSGRDPEENQLVGIKPGHKSDPLFGE